MRSGQTIGSIPSMRPDSVWPSFSLASNPLHGSRPSINWIRFGEARGKKFLLFFPGPLLLSSYCTSNFLSLLFVAKPLPAVHVYTK
eukprot:m.139648 g.139648  ORF g.139648 m.139648 type:complete len:86 (+) comp38280_c2_seq1:812-1069(+)